MYVLYMLKHCYFWMYRRFLKCSSFHGKKNFLKLKCKNISEFKHTRFIQNILLSFSSFFSVGKGLPTLNWSSWQYRTTNRYNPFISVLFLGCYAVTHRKKREAEGERREKQMAKDLEQKEFPGAQSQNKPDHRDTKIIASEERLWWWWSGQAALFFGVVYGLFYLFSWGRNYSANVTLVTSVWRKKKFWLVCFPLFYRWGI